jgi:hypothetical protein
LRYNFQALVKLSLGAEPCWVIQNECSRETRMAVHMAVRNHEYKRKDKINQTNETKQGRCLCNQEFISKENERE